jgi:hypothetical protein
MLPQEAAMFPVIRLWPTLTRALVLMLLSGAVLLSSIPVAASHGGDHSSAQDYTDLAIWKKTDGPGSSFHFTVKIDEDGSARAHGEIHMPDADPPAVLVAIPDSADATFDDLNEDGVRLSMLTMDLMHPSTSEVVSFVFVPIKVIDASGVYRATLTVGNTSLTTDVEVRLTPDRRKGRG